MTRICRKLHLCSYPAAAASTSAVAATKRLQFGIVPAIRAGTATLYGWPETGQRERTCNVLKNNMSPAGQR